MAHDGARWRTVHVGMPSRGFVPALTAGAGERSMLTESVTECSAVVWMIRRRQRSPLCGAPSCAGFVSRSSRERQNMTRTKLSKPGGRRRRKRMREESSAAREHAAQDQHISTSTPEERPPPNKIARSSPDTRKPVESIQAFVESEHAKLRTELKRARKQMNREKAARRQAAAENKQEKINTDNKVSVEAQAADNASSSAKKARTLERRSQRTFHDMQRARADDLIRTSPHQFLWSEYVKWAKENKLAIDDQQQWRPDQITVITEDGQESLMPYVKKVIGPNYLQQTTFRKSKKATPAVAVIALAPSAIRAVHVAKRLYDGQPVGKLFGKHMSAEAQQQWLLRACRKTVVPTAAGTVKRVHRLVEHGHMTLEHTALIVVDFSRDAKLRNILDFPMERNDLFQLLHDFVCARITDGMKVLLTIPENQPVRLEDVTNEEQQT